LENQSRNKGTQRVSGRFQKNTSRRKRNIRAETKVEERKKSSLRGAEIKATPRRGLGVEVNKPPLRIAPDKPLLIILMGKYKRDGEDRGATFSIKRISGLVGRQNFSSLQKGRSTLGGEKKYKVRDGAVGEKKGLAREA